MKDALSYSPPYFRYTATHRCPEALRHHASIRNNSAGVWWFGAATFDAEWVQDTVRYFKPIDYCPYCGAKLPAEENDETH